MVDPSAGGLPTPAQMRTLYDAVRAARAAQRMREASRAVVTGNIAFWICLLGAVLVLAHSGWAGPATPFVMCALLFGCLAASVLSLRWMVRRRARSLVTVVDRREEEIRTAATRPRRSVAVVLAVVLVQAATFVGWGVAFRHMSGAAILACLAVGPLIGMLFFARRFAALRFWEDLLFAGCIPLAYAPFFLQAWDLTPLSFLSLPLVVLSAAALDARWVAWTRALADSGDEDAPEGVRS